MGEPGSDSDEASSVMRGWGVGEVSRVVGRLEGVSSERVEVSDDCESRRPLAESSETDSDEAEEKTIRMRGSGCSWVPARAVAQNTVSSRERTGNDGGGVGT